MLVMGKHVDINAIINSCIDKICKSIEAYIQKGSGWRIARIMGLQVKFGGYRPHKGAGKILNNKYKLPEWIKKRTVF